MSCTVCRAKAHGSETCEATAAREKHNVVAEAMSEKVVRECNKCHARFVKTDGCNLIRCAKCGNNQWWVDSHKQIKSITDPSAEVTSAGRMLTVTSTSR